MDFVHKQLPPGLVPFWATENISQASDYWDKFEVNLSNIYETLEYATLGVMSRVNIEMISKTAPFRKIAEWGVHV